MNCGSLHWKKAAMNGNGWQNNTGKGQGSVCTITTVIVMTTIAMVMTMIYFKYVQQFSWNLVEK
jgi:hypothetical protein